ncbi:MAG: Flp pilus assembly protein CpaB [Dehalococcoidia bacterium]
MARTVAGAAPSRTNRRFLIIAVLLAAVSAVLVYAKIAADDTISGGGAATSDTSQVVVAKAEIPANSVITTDMLEIRNVGINGIAQDALSEPASAIGRVTKYPIAANAQISQSAIVESDRPAEALSEIIPSGKRAISITASQVGNAGGLVLPGDYVDLVWICCNGDDIISKTLLSNVQVAAVAQSLVPAAPQAGSAEQPVPGPDGEPVPDASTTTLLLTPQEAQIIALAEGRGELRIALRGDGDDVVGDSGTAILSDILTPEEVARLPLGLRPEGYQDAP